jgi:hypothetical protein
MNNLLRNLAIRVVGIVVKMIPLLLYVLCVVVSRHSERKVEFSKPAFRAAKALG